MDINTNLTFITCIYDDLFGTEFGGRPHPRNKYFYGVESLTKVNSPIVIYTWPKNVEYVKNYYSEFLGIERFNNQIKVLEFDLYTSPLYDLIKSIKKPEHGIKSDRSYDLMIGKYFMIKDVIEKNIFNSKYFFWIDAGLSSSALFPNKYLNQNYPDAYRRYSNCSLFTPIITEKLVEKCNNNLLLFKLNAIGHWFDPKHINLNDYPHNVQFKLSRGFAPITPHTFFSLMKKRMQKNQETSPSLRSPSPNRRGKEVMTFMSASLKKLSLGSLKSSKLLPLVVKQEYF